MTKKQRAAVVELLRCAAGLDGYIRTAAGKLNEQDVYVIIAAASASVEVSLRDGKTRQERCLLAAQRIEEGWTP